MKKIPSGFSKPSLMLSLVCIFIFNLTEAQYLINGTEKIEYNNDSVILYLKNIRGTLQWQVSDNKTVWFDIAGKTNDSLNIRVDSSAYYRAVITEGTCQPLYSDTVLVAELYDARNNQFYDIIKIGSQWWMADNLNYPADNGSWFFENDSILFCHFGRLYNWQTATEVCPSGWHLPGDDEWQSLERSLGMNLLEAQKTDWRGTDEGTKLKYTGYQHFNSLFGGYKEIDDNYLQVFNVATYWTQTERNADSAWYRGLEDTSKIHRHYYDKRMAFSVRCVKNQPPELVTKVPANIKTKEVQLTAFLSHSGGSEITEKGFCWSTVPGATINDNHIEVSAQVNAPADFFLNLDNLNVNTNYYVNSYAINETGIGYGNEITFKTLPFSIPEVNTTAISNIGTTSARCGGEIIYNGERDITGKGVCWSRSGVPTIDSSHVISGTGTESYISQVSGLKPNTLYFVCAFAINNIGIAYGEIKSFNTLPVNEMDSLTDARDGRVYKTIHIGNQWWMAENLNHQMANSWCYDNNTTNCIEYGRLYTWTTANAACPQNWHHPGDAEWKILETTLGMIQEDVDAIEHRGTNEGTQLKLNGSSGFDVLFGGFRNEDGSYTHFQSGGTFWTKTEYNSTLAWYRGFAGEPTIHRYYYDKDMAFSVRCVRDELPEVITTKVDSVGKTYARCNGEMISNGGLPITALGFCWGTSPDPDINGNHTNENVTSEKYSSFLTGLTTNRTYYIRAYATNAAGTAYGEQMSFSTVTLPKVTTSPITSILTNSATGGGNLTDNGGLTILAMGVCWSTSPEPTIFSTKTIQTGTMGTFTSNITGLEPNKKYYVKAYATNSVGTAYGTQVEFDTPPLFTEGSITDGRDGKVYKTIKIGDQRWTAENLNFQTANSWCYEGNNTNCLTYGRLYSWGTAKTACPARWHLPEDNEWKTLEINLGMSIEEADNTDQRGTDQGTQLKDNGSSGFDVLFGGFRNEDGSYTHLTTGGTFWSSTEYNNTDAWYRGFASDPLIHRYFYDKDMGFSVRCLKDTLPVITTAAVSNLTDSSVNCGGNVTYNGGVAITARGICIGTATNPTIANDTTNNGTGNGAFTSYKKGLSPNTQYYVRAYAINSEGVAYGASVPFKTAIAKPKVTTAVATIVSITDSSAVSGGNVSSNGGVTLTARGVCWDTLPNPTVLLSSKTNNGTATGSYVSNLTNLLPNKNYYYRAYATNSAGTGYGTEYSLTTLVGYAKVTTSAVTSTTETTATGSGNVTSTGGAIVTNRGICWGLNQNPTTADSMLNIGSGPGMFSGQMKNLLPNKTYYVRAYATNSRGTAYGNQVSFKTSTASPQVATDSVGSITTSTAVLYGNVTFDGGSTINERGACWSTGTNPLLSDNKSQAGTGTGIFSASITGLAKNTKYYARAYAINSADTAYGEITSFTTLASLPTLTTTDISAITDSSATTGGSITDDGGAPILSKGVCWNITGNPTVLDDNTLNGSGTATFISHIKGLSANTTYYIRAYAQNSAGYSYGNQKTFKTLHETDSLTDTRDNQKYLAVKIGDDWWMAQNLNFRDTGTVYYDGDSAYHVATYGRLYSWASAMKGIASSNEVPSGVQGVCPSGWHLPSDAEWDNLVSQLGYASTAGSLLKETGNTNWVSGNSDANNETGFTARPGGIVSGTLVSDERGTAAYFWSSTQTDGVNAHALKLTGTDGSVTDAVLQKSNHVSVRCKKN
ncbi:MAG: hypothetical protein JXB00_17090 [Bacteroidales bacterium]|nr:hypothetical protein [Bacteroidales bacterium]